MGVWIAMDVHLSWMDVYFQAENVCFFVCWLGNYSGVARVKIAVTGDIVNF